MPLLGLHQLKNSWKATCHAERNLISQDTKTTRTSRRIRRKAHYITRPPTDAGPQLLTRYLKSRRIAILISRSDMAKATSVLHEKGRSWNSKADILAVSDQPHRALILVQPHSCMTVAEAVFDIATSKATGRSCKESRNRLERQSNHPIPRIVTSTFNVTRTRSSPSLCRGRRHNSAPPHDECQLIAEILLGATSNYGRGEPARTYKSIDSISNIPFLPTSSNDAVTATQQPQNSPHTTLITAILASFVAGLETSNGPLTAEADAAKLVQCVDELHDSRKHFARLIDPYSLTRLFAQHDGKAAVTNGNGHWESPKDCIGDKCAYFLLRSFLLSAGLGGSRWRQILLGLQYIRSVLARFNGEWSLFVSLPSPPYHHSLSPHPQLSKVIVNFMQLLPIHPQHRLMAHLGVYLRAQKFRKSALNFPTHQSYVKVSPNTTPKSLSHLPPRTP
ncbi:uncharacterized protein MYCFIDRAFT_178643 [Pseudocercospora fijiensis CIRAD86]|uniref:Uncharacterized protein n=1 Tax=Pseudocercospora fijiensis (strain CIRAD86) TaxID=383855 RepID=M2YL90_PSEFD|nr:uncharacterized protein MYCFIDRAFT_178643 [Pseudocercospora fijiensis CIRAD86]EME78505.1 hypothetical protein MYCFIDRAFT_178643 [Pseudocercospora fijiensis CIRAD86]